MAMTKRFVTLALVSLALTGTGWGAWVEVSSPIVDQVPITAVQSSGPDAWQMDISVPGLTQESVVVEGESYDRLSLPMEMMAGQDGEADLPVISRLVALRSSGDPLIEVVSEEWVELEGTYQLALNLEGTGSQKRSAGYMREDVYLPEASYVVTPRQVMGGVSLAVVQIRAAKYNPAQGKVRVLKSAQLQVHESGPAVSYDRPITETTAGMLRALVPNWDEVGVDVEVVRGTLLYIVANDSTVRDHIEPLTTWRARKGYTVEIAGPDEIDPWSTGDIKNYILERYNDADPPLEFVCLVGDADGTYYIPAYERQGFWFDSWGAGDWDYTRLDSDDMLPDIAIGRYCFDTLSELDVLVNKTYYYERDPAPPAGGDNPSWFKGGGCVAGSGTGISPVYTMRWVHERMLDAGYTASSIDTVYYIHEWVSPQRINTCFNSGISLYCYRGYQFMGNPHYYAWDLNYLSNGRRLPFMVVISCSMNDYNGDDQLRSILEYFVKAGTTSDPKGAIGGIGTSSIDTRTRYNNCIVGGVIQGLLREGIHTMGGCLNRSKLELCVNYPADSAEAGFFCHITSLLGDPAVDIFTDTPETLFVDSPTSVPVGTNNLTLTVTNGAGQPVVDAYVHLLKESEVFVGDWTDANGQVLFNFTTTTADTLFVTATKHNCRPAINHTLVTTSGRYVSPATSTFVIDDDNTGESHGNDDGLANPGETIELALPLKNWGTSTTDGVEAALSLTDPFVVNIGDGDEYYGTIASGATVDPEDDFDFTIADYAPDGYVLQFALTVTDDASDTWISAVPIAVSNGNLEYDSHTLMGVGDGVLDPGESGEIWLELTNVGTRETVAGTVGELHSGNAAVTITDNTCTFSGSVPSGSCDNEADPFGLSASALAFPGERIPLSCVFPLADGFADTIRFNLYIGSVASNSPTPPDSYGYWAFDNTDVAYEKHPTYDWVEIDPRFGGSGTVLGITDNSDEDDTTVVVELPFTFQYYGEEFDQVCVCSNGWIAMGADQVVHKTFRNWHIPGALGPSAMIAPFWDDLYRIRYDGSHGRIYVYNDTANHRFIIEWSRVLKYNDMSDPTETFECILCEPAYPATPTGDGEILFQYHTCSNVEDVLDPDDGWPTSNDYATVGIENLDETDGVLYSYWNQTDPDIPGAAPMTSERAILFTTQKAPMSYPKAPTHLTAVRSGSMIELRWNAVHEDIYGNPVVVDEYKVYRDTSPFFTPDESAYVGSASDTTYQDVGAMGDGKYFYVVQANLSGSFSSSGSTNQDAGMMRVAAER